MEIIARIGEIYCWIYLYLHSFRLGMWMGVMEFRMWIL